MSVRHDLKVWPQYFDALTDGTKSFEFRRDDREPAFAVGHVLNLREWQEEDRHATAGYTSRSCERYVTYVARGGVIPAGFCVMSIVPLRASVTAGDQEERDA